MALAEPSAVPGGVGVLVELAGFEMGFGAVLNELDDAVPTIAGRWGAEAGRAEPLGLAVN